MRFTDLLGSARVTVRGELDLDAVAEARRKEAEKFPALVRRSKLKLWSGTAGESKGCHAVIGVRLYSGPDLELLDRLNEMLEECRGSITVEVFDDASCPEPEQLERYIPGITPVSQTPVVGVWIDGALMEKASGFKGRKLILRTVSEQCR